MADSISIIKLFPKLAADSKFAITSPEDNNYNCIAWAFGLYSDRWMQPLPEQAVLDGIIWWPDGVTKDKGLKAYVEAFESIGFELCDSYELEDKFLKIALYENLWQGQLICSHAARQKICGSWMSKLGQWNDIEHGTPFTLEGASYGKVSCCMKIKRY